MISFLSKRNFRNATNIQRFYKRLEKKSLKSTANVILKREQKIAYDVMKITGVRKTVLTKITHEKIYALRIARNLH